MNILRSPLVQSFFDGFTMAGLFGESKIPGAPTQLCADEPLEFTAFETAKTDVEPLIVIGVSEIDQLLNDMSIFEGLGIVMKQVLKEKQIYSVSKSTRIRAILQEPDAHIRVQR